MMTLTPQQLDRALADAREAAILAWRAIRHFYRGSYDIFEKDEGPATEADILADRTILGHLRARYDEAVHGYLSEELAHGPERLALDLCWIIDPIDGTRDFIAGREDFAVQIALAGRVGDDSIPLVAIVYQPATGHLYAAKRGGGATVELIPEALLAAEGAVPPPSVTAPIAPSSRGDLLTSHSVVTRSNISKKLQRVIDHLGIAETSNRGSFGVKVAEVATGRADLYLNTAHRRCKEWDVCAPHLILEEAGGRLTDLAGRAITYNKADVYVDYGAVASNSLLHPEVLSKLEEISDVWKG
jgi:3'(2'), 5'-bisphosphate nucleotidase